MNKYQEEFDMACHLNPLDHRERTCLNYGIEQGKIESNVDFAELLKSMITEYPKSKGSYIDLDVYVRNVMVSYANRQEENNRYDKEMV